MYSRIQSRANSPFWISARDLLHGLAHIFVDNARAAGKVAVFGGLADELVHLGDAAFVDQVDDQLHFVQALEVGGFGLVARFNQRIESRHDQFAHAAAEYGLLAEKVGLGFFLEGGFDHPGVRAADSAGVAERALEGVAAVILMDGQQAGNAAARFVLAADQVAGSSSARSW